MWRYQSIQIGRIQYGWPHHGGFGASDLDRILAAVNVRLVLYWLADPCDIFLVETSSNPWLCKGFGRYRWYMNTNRLAWFFELCKNCEFLRLSEKLCPAIGSVISRLGGWRNRTVSSWSPHSPCRTWESTRLSYRSCVSCSSSIWRRGQRPRSNYIRSWARYRHSLPKCSWRPPSQKRDIEVSLQRAQGSRDQRLIFDSATKICFNGAEWIISMFRPTASRRNGLCLRRESKVVIPCSART